jgi:glycosyltransferase involved in cell wall biosynthesis
VVLIAIKDDQTPAYEQRSGYTVKRVELRSRRLPRKYGLRLLRFAEAIWRTFVAAWREDADIYNPRDAEPLLVAHAAAALRRAKVVYDSDELNLDQNAPWARKRWWRFAMKRFEGYFARRSAAVITSDNGRADILAERYRIPRPAVVRNVPEDIAELDPDQGFRDAALGDGSYLLIYQGVYDPNRGLPELIDAMRELPDCRLAFVGYGQLEDELKKRTMRAGMQDRVRFFDAVPFEVMMRYTAAADIGIFPLVGSCLSYVHAAPNKLFEFMLSALPVVVSDLPEMAAVVRDERIGELIEDPEDPHSIASAVRALIEGPESLQTIGARAREAARARHHWGIDKQVLLDVYRTIGALG